MTHKGNGDQMIDDLLDIEDVPEEPKPKRKNDEGIRYRKMFDDAWKPDVSIHAHPGRNVLIRIVTVWTILLSIGFSILAIVALFGWWTLAAVLGFIAITFLIFLVVTS